MMLFALIVKLIGDMSSFFGVEFKLTPLSTSSSSILSKGCGLPSTLIFSGDRINSFFYFIEDIEIIYNINYNFCLQFYKNCNKIYLKYKKASVVNKLITTSYMISSSFNKNKFGLACIDL